MLIPPLTKIIATVGPACRDVASITRLVEAGVSVFRINFSHGEADEQARDVETIRSVSRSLGRPVAILGDLPGPKIRIGRVEDDGIEVPTGSMAVLQRRSLVAVRPAPGEVARFSSTCEALVDDVQIGQRVLVDDGNVRMRVVATRADEFECDVTSGGLIRSGKGINLPDTALGIATVTERDRQLAAWAAERELDFLAMSFVRSADDVRTLAEAIVRPGDEHAGLPIIAKVELPAAVENMESIIDAADAIMIARGDLGVEMDLARVPVVQKQLIAAARAFGKPCIVATQMLETMIHSPGPTRAEASDVAGAIFDGIDAVMLSGETAIGAHPVAAVETMRRIAEQTEAYLATLEQVSSAPQKLRESHNRTAALAHGVWTIAQDVDARCIVVWSQHGGGARYLSQNDFSIPIFAMTTDERVARQMQLLRGVVPLRAPVPDDLPHFSRLADALLQEIGWARPGDVCILMAGWPLGRPGVTNRIAVHEIAADAAGFD